MQQQTDPVTDAQRRFVRDLVELEINQDRGALAALRRGLGRLPGTAGEMHSFVIPRLPDTNDPNDPDVDAFYIVGALFGWHPLLWQGARGRWKSNLGASIARLDAEDPSPSTERRFIALLNAHPEDLQNHLERTVGLLKSKEIPVDYYQLLMDISHWDSETRSVQRRWAGSFWGDRRREEIDPDTTD